ncbi:hypothetical protein CPB97_007918 [Podila verticillata]|nr:hypothetical protein CPB97_007918 [Podila verticillata]
MDPAHHPSSSGPVHCFWALMTYGDLRFIYLSSSVQRAVSAKYKQLLGQSFFDYIHPDEAKLARKDLNAFMDVHNLYGSVTRCRFKNVCPEWQQRRLTRRKSFDDPSPTDSAALLQAAAAEGGLSSRGLGQGGLHNEPTTQSNNTNNSNNNANNNTADNDKNPPPQGDDIMSECKDYDDLFPNGDADDFMILDVVMNVVSDEVVLGFFHIDGQGLYKGFWSNGICGESMESLPTLAPEILRHLQDSAQSKTNTQDNNRTEGSPPTSPRRQSDNKTKRIFQLYDSQNRNLLLTWPEPSGNQSKDVNAMVYNPELYTHIVKSHHIPTDALENTTCLKRFCSKHALPSLNPSSQEPSYQVESVFIPYGHIIFACFQTSPSTPTSTWASMSSPSSSITTPSAHPAVSTPSRAFGSTDAPDHLSGLGLLPSPGQLSSSMFPLSSSSPSNQPLVIPSLPSLSPFLKHASAGQMTMTSGAGVTPTIGAIRNSPGAALFHPYSRTSALSANSSGASSPSSLPLPESMQESLSFLNDYKAGDYDRESGRSGLDPNENSPHSVWRASTPHPAIAAMVGHALAPSAPTFQRTVGQDPRSSSRKSFEGDSGFGPNGPLGHAAEISHSGSSKHRKNLSSGHRHPAHDAAIRKRTSSPPGHPSSSSSSPPSSHPELDSNGRKEHGHANSHGGLVLRVSQEEKACESCHTTNSPEWRRGPSGKKDLCNACGLRYSRSVARQNRQAQKQLEGGGKPKVKTPKTPKTPKGKKGHGQHEHGHGDNRSGSPEDTLSVPELQSSPYGNNLGPSHNGYPVSSYGTSPVGHYASVCTEPERLCYNCKQSGHESNLCPMPRTSDAKQCYSCGGVGHIQADCPTIRLQRNAAAGGGRCYNCGMFGHMARNCRNQLRYGPPPRSFQGNMDNMGNMGGDMSPTPDGNPNVNIPMAQGHQGGYPHRGGRGGYMGHSGRPMHMNGPSHNNSHNNQNQNHNNNIGRVVCFKCGGLNHYSRDCKANGAKCYSCGKYGHISRECPTLVGGVVDKTNKTCYRCGEHGHISRDCPTAAEA